MFHVFSRGESNARLIWTAMNLRHSLASFLIRIRTDPKTVQTLLRHSDVKLTLQFYTHAVSRERMVAAGKMLTPILSMRQTKTD